MKAWAALTMGEKTGLGIDSVAQDPIYANFCHTAQDQRFCNDLLVVHEE